MNYTTKARWRNNTTDNRHAASRCVQRLCPFAAGSPRFASARGPGRAARSPYHPTTRRVLVFTSEQFFGHLADVHLLDDKVAAVVLARDLEGRAERAAAEHIPALVLVHARGGGLRLPPSGSSRAHQRWHRDNPVTVQRQNAAA